MGVAEQLGGDWAERARAAALALDGEREQATDPNAALIQDVREVLTDLDGPEPGHQEHPGGDPGQRCGTSWTGAC